LNDSPALYGDIWVILALIAGRTRRLGLGTAVLIPNLRHPVAQASAIATLEQLAPGRVVAAFGTGFTGRMAMGQKPLTWSYMRRYLRRVRGLLNGDEVEVEGRLCKMIHPPGFAPQRPINVPILVGANGPKGLETAQELGDGIVSLFSAHAGFKECAVLTFGTVLDDDEDINSPRVIETAGPALAALYHSQMVAALPRGSEWLEMMEQFPAESRHLITHELHVVAVNDHDRPFIDAASAAAATFTGTRAALRDRLQQMEAAGATEVMFQPTGSDIERELRAFADMAEIGAPA
jgi:5,10-methylenetetrahydromethanopterin reductase